MHFASIFYVMIYQNLIQQSFMIKTESIQMKRKRIECNNHGDAIKYRCQSQLCTSPYLCAHFQCIDQHFHNDAKLVLTRFDSKLWESKFQQVENVLNNQTLKVKEQELTKLVQYFTSSLQKIHKEMNKFKEVKDKICQQEVVSPNPQYFQNINGFLSLSNKLQRKLDHLRAKIVDEEYISFEDTPPLQQNKHIEINESNPLERQQEVALKSKVQILKNREDHQQNPIHDLQQQQSQNINFSPRKNVQSYENPQLIAFLKKHINKFQWSFSDVDVVFSSQSHHVTCQKFHQKLKDRKHLLFLFFGDRQIIGSYYSEPYPSIAEKHRKDVNSFIFIRDEEAQEKFSIFYSDSQSDSHINVSQKLLICQGNTPNNGDGLRTFQRNFESLAYFLPSLSFNNPHSSREVTYNGVLKIKQFYILQLLSL